MTKGNSLRSQFKATSLKSLKKAVSTDDAMVGVSSNEYLNLEDGKALKIRIFPAHPGVDTFYISKKCYWLSFDGNDGQRHRGTVLDSRAHGGTKYDLVDEYVKWAKKKWGNDADKIEALVGSGPKSNSLNPQFSWLCYADKVEEGCELRAKIWEFKKMVRDALNKLTFDEDEDDVIETDPFTDPDDGLVITAKYLKNPNKKKGENFYEVDFAKQGKKKETVTRPLTDEELEYFSSLKPLNEILPKYGINEFNRALEGLQIFDEENDMGLFDDDDWLEHVEEIKAQYDADEDDEEKPKKKATKKVTKKVEVDDEDDEDTDTDDEEEEEEKPKKSSKKSAKVEEEEEDDEDEDNDDSEDDEDEEESEDGDKFDDMDRKELKSYIKEHSLDISVKKSMEDDDIREAIRKAEATEEPDAEDDDDDEDDEEEEPKAKISLADIRKKLRK